VNLIERQVLNYYMYGAGQPQLRQTINKYFAKSLGNNLATTLALLPGSQLVKSSLREAKRARNRQDGVAAVPPPNLGTWAWPVDFWHAVMHIGVGPLVELVFALGARTVDCVTIRPASTRYAVTAVPLLEPFPGLPEIPYTLKRGNRTLNEPADPITALVLLTWALWLKVHINDVDYTPLYLVTVHHKATLIEAAGLEWWTRGCSCDRAALCLISEDDAITMRQAASELQRPKKPRAPKLYAYLGGGVDHQPKEVSSIVIRTRDPEFITAVVAATRLAMATWPSGTVAATFDEELVDGDMESTVNLAFELNTYQNYVPAAVGEPARHLVRTLFESVHEVRDVPPPAPPTNAQQIVQEFIIDVDEAEEDPPASALHRGFPLTSTPAADEPPDWGGEEEPASTATPTELPTASTASSSTSPATATASTVPSTARPSIPGPAPTPPATRRVRFGVDLGGVLWPFIQGDLSVQRAIDVGAVSGAFAWMHHLVRHIGAENVYIVSKVGFRGQRVWGAVLHAAKFYRTTGVPINNVKWVQDRTGPGGKAPVVEQLQLTHFVDDHADVLCDIRRHFLGRRLALPELYIVPTMSWDENAQEAWQFERDMILAERAAQHHRLNFATGLLTVPLPDLRAP
jgi:hypothetical protein